MSELDFLNQDPDEYSEDRESYQYLIDSLEPVSYTHLAIPWAWWRRLTGIFPAGCRLWLSAV